MVDFHVHRAPDRWESCLGHGLEIQDTMEMAISPCITSMHPPIRLATALPCPPQLGRTDDTILGGESQLQGT